MDYPDLLVSLQQARATVPDLRHVWPAIGESFETTVQRRRGLLLGGAHSPLFLRDRAQSTDVPWTVTLRNVRVLPCAAGALADWRAWLPTLEAAAQAHESLLFVAPNIESEFLHTLVVNLAQNTLPACVVHPLGGRAAGMAMTTPPTQLGDWPLFAEGRVRRSASVLYPADNAAAATPNLSDIAEIRVGGRHVDDQMQRLRALMDELER